MHNTPKRPRVAAVGLDQSQMESIAPLCGDLRPADSVRGYLKRYNWTETDITVLGSEPSRPTVIGHVLAVDSWNFGWRGFERDGARSSGVVGVSQQNTERELRIPATCPARYRQLATELTRQLRSSAGPFPSRQPYQDLNESVSVLVETTSGLPVALHCVDEKGPGEPEAQVAIVLALPEQATLAAWFRVFLAEVHEVDRTRVPQPPPRVDTLWDWHTPEERVHHTRIVEIEDTIKDLQAEKTRAKDDLDAATQIADAGVRRSIWADGDDLVAAIGEILSGLGFVVRDLDAEREHGEAKREDLRLTVADRPGWEAIAEVKGYTGGTKTSDVRQIREYRDRYFGEEQRIPDRTWWIANPYRTMDPSNRPVPESTVGERAADIGAVHVLAIDLYRLWARVMRGELEDVRAVQQLLEAAPGLWSLDALHPDTATKFD